MSATLDLYIDTSTGQLVEGGSVVGGALPTLTRNDSYTLRLRLLEKQTNGSFSDVNLAGASLKVGIGTIEDEPSAGAFKLSVNGITSSEIPFNATAVCVFNAISNNVSTVALYGNEAFGAYLLTATQPNTAMSFSSDSFTLFPSSSVLVGTRRNPTTGVNAQQIIRLIRNPIVFSDTFTASPTAGEISLTNIQDGSASQNETYELTVGPRVLGGSYALVFGPNATTGIELFSTAASVQAAISASINTITSNVSVADNGKLGYIISFTGRLGLTNIATALTLDSSGVDFIPFQQTTLTINTAEVEDAFADAGTDSISPTLEVELTQNNSPKTILQSSVNIRKDLINTGAAVPAPQSAYLTASEIAAQFIADSTANIDATNRKLVDSSGNAFIDWESKKIGYGVTEIDLSGNSITFPDNLFFSFGATTGTQIGTTTSQKLGFFSASPIGQPAETNVLSALSDLGLVATSVSFGNSVVSNSSLNVNATSQSLHTAAQRSVDWGSRSLINATGTTVAVWRSTALSLGAPSGQINLILADNSSVNSISFGTTWGSKIGTATAQKIGFWNSTPVTQPNQSNVVTALRGCGLIAGGPSVSTFGVFPLSSRTLTTTASINYGTILNNSSATANVTVTGAVLNDVVMLGLPASLEQGLSFTAHVTSTDTVQVDAINATNGNITQSAQTFRVVVVGY